MGYQISPLLWDKVRRGLSAGRVQTVALRLIVEREEEINNFKPVEYWTIGARLKSGAGPEFSGKFTGIDGETARVANGVDADGKEQFPPVRCQNEAETNRVVKVSTRLHGRWSVERKERKRNPTAPYTTSKLQQDASSRLGFNVRRTMTGVAQRLYEGARGNWAATGNGQLDYVYAYGFDAGVS